MPYVEVEGKKIHYRQQGDGPPLVLLHGLGNNSESFRHQLEDLSDQFTVIAWDAPGYGRSDDPDQELQYFEDFAKILKKFVEKLRLEPFYLLGHSMGSTLSLAFYRLYPDSVKALILADATRGGAAKDGADNRQKLEKRLHDIETRSPEEIAKERVENLLAPHAPSNIREEAERIYACIRPMGYRSVSYALYHADQTEVLPMIDVPTLVICGELDRITPVAESKIIHRGIRQSQLVLIPHTGHLCYQEDPQSFNRHVRAFLQKIE